MLTINFRMDDDAMGVFNTRQRALLVYWKGTSWRESAEAREAREGME